MAVTAFLVGMAVLTVLTILLGWKHYRSIGSDEAKDPKRIHKP
jgi:hypothetical protein